VIAYLALFVALGGSSYAAIKVTGKNVADSSLTGKDVRNSSLTTSDVKNRSLLAADFKGGQLPAGAPGPPGLQGERGAPGEHGQQGDRGDAGASVFSSTIPSGTTITGLFAHVGPAASGATIRFGVSFPVPAPVTLDGDDVNFSDSSGENDASCTGSGSAPTAPAGKVCLYATSSFSTTQYSGEGGGGFGDSPYGFIVAVTSNGASANNVGVQGTWAYTAP
jgi:hypothetical protein